MIVVTVNICLDIKQRKHRTRFFNTLLITPINFKMATGVDAESMTSDASSLPEEQREARRRGMDDFMQDPQAR